MLRQRWQGKISYCAVMKISTVFRNERSVKQNRRRFMKKKIGFLALLLTASVALADPADDIRNAAKKLAEKGNYSWRTTTDSGATAGNFRPGPTEGKTEKDGITYLSLTRGDNTMEAVLKEKKGAIRTQDGWKSISELTAEDSGGQPSPGRF